VRLPLAALPLVFALSGIVAAQSPGMGWVMVPSDRVTKTLFWELFKKTEVWTQLAAQTDDGSGRRMPVALVFSATFDGKHLTSSEIQKAPEQVHVTAQAGPMTVFTKMSLEFRNADGTRVDLSAGADAHYLYPNGCNGCGATGIQGSMDASAVRALAASPNVKGEALGIPFVFARADRDALRDFARYVHIIDGGAPR
jgi:hypothetical protein